MEGNVGDAIYKTVCPLCGAVREDKQIGLEETPEEYVARLVGVFREIRRVLKDDGTLWLNIGDSYNSSPAGNKTPSGFSQTRPSRRTGNGHQESVHTGRKLLKDVKPKDLIGIPWMLAFALREDGWYLRQDIIWHKPNPMPESVKDRCTKSHEYIFLLSKSPKYYFDHEAIQEEATGHERWKFKNLQDKGQQTHSMHERRADGASDIVYPVRNKRDVWTVSTKPYKEAHFATFPEELITPCILAGCPKDGIVIDPFFGSGTTGYVATKYNRNYIGIELNPKYIDIAKRRLSNVQLSFIGML